MKAYYIVPQQALEDFGDLEGSTREEAERWLDNAEGDTDNLVVILGEVVSPSFHLPDIPEESK